MEYTHGERVVSGIAKKSGSLLRDLPAKVGGGGEGGHRLVGDDKGKRGLAGGSRERTVVVVGPKVVGERERGVEVSQHQLQLKYPLLLGIILSSLYTSAQLSESEKDNYFASGRMKADGLKTEKFISTSSIVWYHRCRFSMVNWTF